MPPPRPFQEGPIKHPDDSSSLSGLVERIGLGWVAACLVGWVVGGLVGAALGSSGQTSIDGLLVVAAASVLTGGLQSAVLRSVVAAGAWVAATVGAVGLVSVTVFLVPALDAGVAVAATGTVLGLAQWLVLRGPFERAGWWVVASTVGWVAGGFLSGAFEGGIAGWATIGVVYGAVTGAGLAWPLRRRHPAAIDGRP